MRTSLLLGLVVALVPFGTGAAGAATRTDTDPEHPPPGAFATPTPTPTAEPTSTPTPGTEPEPTPDPDDDGGGAGSSTPAPPSLPTPPAAGTPAAGTVPSCAACEAAAAKARTCGSRKARVAVLVFHGGGFATGSPADTLDTCRALGAAGFHAVNLPYPLLDLLAAQRTVMEAADRLRQRHQTVFAYGESAGGTLALLLAARSYIDRAYAWAPVSDLVRWQEESVEGFVRWEEFPDASPATLRELSPITHANRRSSPVLVEHGKDDVHVPGAQSTRLKARWPAMTLRWVRGGHLPDSPGYLRATDSAVRYFRERPRPVSRANR